jgi:hypothetical protein
MAWGKKTGPGGDQLVQGGWLAARFGHREHHLAPYLKLGDAWGDNLDGGPQPDVQDPPGRLDAFDLGTGLQVQQAINQRRGVADLAPRSRDGVLDRLTRPLVGRQTPALPSDQSAQPAGRGQLTDQERERTVDFLARIDPHVAAHRGSREQLFLAAEVEMNDLIAVGSHDRGRQRRPLRRAAVPVPASRVPVQPAH